MGCSIAKTLIALGDSNSYDDLEIMEINSINGNIKLHVIFTYIKFILEFPSNSIPICDLENPVYKTFANISFKMQLKLITM